jgi:hypothetical protein
MKVPIRFTRMRTRRQLELAGWGRRVRSLINQPAIAPRK